MCRFKFFKLLGTICLASFLAFPVQLLAQDDDPFGFPSEDLSDGGNSSDTAEESFKDMSEDKIINIISDRMSKQGDDKYPNRLRYDSSKKIWTVNFQKVTKDPFKPIVEKNAPIAPVRRVQEVKPVEKPKPAAPPVKPIKLFVSGIVGNEGSRLAIVKFENEEMTITKDQIVEGKFKVVDIYADRVVVYSNKEQRRHTFKIGGDEK